MGTIILKCNSFRICWCRSAALIYSLTSHFLPYIIIQFLNYIFTSHLRNTHEKKFRNHKIPTRKKIWTHEFAMRIKLHPQNTQEKKFRTHEIPTRKNFEPTKYLREKKLGPWNTYKKKILDTRRHDLIIERDPRNLAHS